MTLSERLAKARTKTDDQVSVTYHAESPDTAQDPLADLKRKVHNSLLDVLGPKLYDQNMTAEQLGTKVRRELARIMEVEETPLSAADRARVIADSTDDIMGYGPLEPFLRDPTVTEVMVNGYASVFVERDGKLTRTVATFLDDAHLRRTIEKIVGRVGRRIDEAQPYVDARLADGSRVNAAIPPIAIDGPLLTVRKFSRDPYYWEDLVSFGSLTKPVASFLEKCVRGKINILVSGGTGAGKTTTLNVLSSCIDPTERILTIEDSAELRLMQPHVVRMEHRPPNIEGRGEVSIRDLVRNALRMRPDRIIVGEVRGGEALDMLQAMNTGHDGSISTVHANTPRDVCARLETMCLMAGMDLPARAIREQIASAVQLIVHQARMPDGSRRITHVTEVGPMEGDVITLQDLFLYDFGMGTDENGHSKGHIKSLGIRPRFDQKLRDQGIPLEASLFEPERFASEKPERFAREKPERFVPEKPERFARGRAR